MNDKKGLIKCVVWDLDNTLWNGTLLEDSSVTLNQNIEHIIKTLDERGILQSIASKNNHDDAIKKLEEFRIEKYFLFPQIHWNSKVQSLQYIGKSFNIGMDSIAFIDDNPAEIDEVAFSMPEIMCINADSIDHILEMTCMVPEFITSDQKKRRLMYLADIGRNKEENAFQGPKEEFLASLEMVLNIFPAKKDDLQRAEELTVRTNQLNATGYTYSYDELNHFRVSDNHLLLMAKLTDRYGTYGHIGLALVECHSSTWIIKLLLMSCRVMSRGTGSVLLCHLIRSARENNVKLQAEFVPNDRNRIMNVTYRFAGFEEIDNRNGVVILQYSLERSPSFPDYMKIIIEKQA